jgi:hypothetical protein
MLLDVRGNVLSNESPSSTEIEKAYKSSIATNATSDMSYYVQHPTTFGRLSFKVLRNIYEVSSSVRPAVDSIARECSSQPWNVLFLDKKYHKSTETKEVVAFFKNVNLDREDIGVVLAKFVNDLLVIGRGVIEKVRNPMGKVLELVARDATLFQPIYKDNYGITGYQEYERNTYKKLRVHKKEDIIFRYFTPVTYTAGSLPIIETIVNEVALLMLSVKSIAWAFTHDEIPPGILHLGQIGNEAIERAKASFEAARGEFGKNKLRVVDNVDKVQWVQLSRPFREMQVAELIPVIERIVARNFGLAPVETGLSDVSHGTADASIKSSQSKLMMPLITLVTTALNQQVINEFNPELGFVFVGSPLVTVQAEAEPLIALWRAGLNSRNEIRLKLGDNAVPGGDLYTVLLGNEVVPLEEDTGLPKPRPAEDAAGPQHQSTYKPGAVKPMTAKITPINKPVKKSVDEIEEDEEAALDLDEEEFEDLFGFDSVLKKNLFFQKLKQ